MQIDVSLNYSPCYPFAFRGAVVASTSHRNAFALRLLYLLCMWHKTWRRYLRLFVYLHQRRAAHPPQEEGETIPFEVLRRYIQYARQQQQPLLSLDARDALKNFYVQTRWAAMPRWLVYVSSLAFSFSISYAQVQHCLRLLAFSVTEGPSCSVTFLSVEDQPRGVLAATAVRRGVRLGKMSEKTRDLLREKFLSLSVSWSL